MNIFYSWQSDIPNKYNRSFIEDCINQAIKKLKNQQDIIIIYDLDRDTKNLMGTVDIAESLFTKIKNTDVFIGDISLINNDSLSKPKTPNPNVLVELGFGASSVGWENIICIFNESFGRIEELPFDLRQRRPLVYKLCGFSTKNEKDNIRNKLISDLVYILENLNPESLEAKRIIEKEFIDESIILKRIVSNKPKQWIENLFYELLKTRLNKLETKHQYFKEGIIFQPAKLMNNEEFLSWLSISITDFQKRCMICEKLCNEALPKSYNEIAEDYYYPVKLKDIIDKIYFLIESSIDWEVKLQSIKVSEEIEYVKNEIFDWSLMFINFIKEVKVSVGNAIRNFDKNCTTPKTINTKMEGIPNLDKLIKSINEFRVKNYST